MNRELIDKLDELYTSFKTSCDTPNRGLDVECDEVTFLSTLLIRVQRMIEHQYATSEHMCLRDCKEIANMLAKYTYLDPDWK